MPFVIGESLGPYRITEQLGQGGMATVFKAYHAALDRYVAIKALHPAFTEDPNFLARFQREARVVAKLEHPNIVPIYDFAEHEGRPYLVMKYIEGETLKARLGRGSLSLDETIQIADSVGAGLAYAHRQGILHRDVKPSNVILSKDGQIYLADFGLARIATAGESTLSSDMMLGTPQYISPEQALGKRDLDEGTDIYSFGVLLYEMTVGKVPYTADTPYAIIHDHIYSPLPMPRTVNPNVPEAVERALLKALAKDRSDRFGSVTELVQAFKAAMSGVAEMPSTVLTPVKRDEAPATVVAVSLSGTAGDSPAPEMPQAPVVSSSKRPFWRRRACVLPIVLLALVCLCLAAVILRKATQGPNPPQVLGIPTIAASPGQLPALPPSGRPGDQPPAGEPAQGLDAAAQRVKENPEDPQAHLELAIAFFREGNYPEARLEFENVRKLGGEEARFYADAGTRLAGEQQWVPAAWAFLQAAMLSPDLEANRWADLWREAVYKGCILPGFDELMPLDEIEKVDAPMAAVARGRQALYANDRARAELPILKILQEKPDFAEARLVHADILARGNSDIAVQQAKTILENLQNKAALPPWIQDEARRIYQEQIGK